METTKKTGFTLIELLIVVAIIGILAAIAVPNFLNAQMRAKISRVQADMKAVSTALEQYYLDYNSYVEDHDWPTGGMDERGLFRLTTPVAYMNSLPLDPFPSSQVRNWTEDNPHFEFGSGNATRAGVQWPAQAYLIISPGPDLNEEVSGNDGFPFGTTIYSFDPSNGLSSTGDIVRMGGQYSSGRIMVDGKMLFGG
ncbi:MAG: prepilin-type N-terminal cleavage/methylation domain-containing protein [Candidatus Omnitrophota bacterium]|nr:MAG: prepilin-type N-terminal cleavage/methylation domain-containing protein [Candidatus Omnitrophota bacterium]